jgi:hypothetical protein
MAGVLTSTPQTHSNQKINVNKFLFSVLTIGQHGALVANLDNFYVMLKPCGARGGAVSLA